MLFCMTLLSKLSIITATLECLIIGGGGLFFGGEIDNPPQLLRTPPIIRLVIFSGSFVRFTDFSFGHVCEILIFEILVHHSHAHFSSPLVIVCISIHVYAIIKNYLPVYNVIYIISISENRQPPQLLRTPPIIK